MQASVPLRNVYYLLCYAWKRHRERDLVETDALEGTQGAALIAKIIHDGVTHLLRRGLDRGYRTFVDETSQPRGKLLVNATVQRGLLQHGRVVCEQDELTRDILNNQLLLAT
ncbi:MAG: hypothetical protein KC468_36065, partial [Myxococcales bacterium]|nr:hypothetical protein [Myxococcales bacterium]